MRAFEKFMDEVDYYMVALTGVSHQHIEDYNYYFCFENGDHPWQVALEALENAEMDVPEEWWEELDRQMGKYEVDNNRCK